MLYMMDDMGFNFVTWRLLRKKALKKASAGSPA